MHSQANLVVLVDDLLNGVVYALTGYGEYADWSGTLSAPLMHFVGQLYMLLVPWGGVGWGGGVSQGHGCVLTC